MALLTALAGHESALAIIERIDGHAAPSLPYAIGAFVVFTLAFYGAYDNPLPQKLRNDLRIRVALWGALTWIVCSAAFIALFLFADQLHRAVGGNLDLEAFLAYLVLFAAVGTLARKLVRGQLLVVHSRYVESQKMGDRDRAKHLIFFLSDIEKEYESTGWLPKDFPWTDSLDDDVAELKRRSIRWKWEMPLRGLRPHRKLEAITLICSEESIPQADAFAACVKHYPEFEHLEIRVWCERNDERRAVRTADAGGYKGFRFHDVDQLSSAVVDLMKYLRFGEHVKARDIIIDFTGGQKPASVIAAAVTFRGEVRAQYVDTNEPWDTLEYDLVTNLEPKEV